jgi:hypothetical protein
MGAGSASGGVDKNLCIGLTLFTTSLSPAVSPNPLRPFSLLGIILDGLCVAFLFAFAASSFVEVGDLGPGVSGKEAVAMSSARFCLCILRDLVRLNQPLT